MIELVTGVVINQNELLLARSKNHGWWELPGTKSNGQPEEMLRWALQHKLGIRVPRLPGVLPLLDYPILNIAGVEFAAQIRRVTCYEGYPMEQEQSGYIDTKWASPLRYTLPKDNLSPVAEHCVDFLSNHPRLLLEG